MKTIYDSLTAEDVYGALFTHGGDPWIVEYEEDAQQIAETINNASHRGEVKNDLDKDSEYGHFATAMRQLDFDKECNPPEHIYHFTFGNSGLICFRWDWN